jgi:hypothetical protein
VGTIPTTPTFTAGEKLTAAELEQINDAVDFWALTPRCYAYQSLTHNTWAPITLDAEVYDIVQSGDTTSHDLSTDNSRIYVRTSGKYELSGQVQVASNATGYRAAQIRLNAAGSSAGGSGLAVNYQGAISGVSTSVNVIPVEASLNAGDYIELFGLQNSGGALNTVGGLGVTYLRLKLTGS